MAQPGRGQDGTAGPEATPDPAGPGLTRALLGPAALLGLGGLLLLHGPAWAALAVAALLPAGLAGCWPACRQALRPAAPPAPPLAEALAAYPVIAQVLRQQLDSALRRSEDVTYELHERLNRIDALAPAPDAEAADPGQAEALRGLVLEALATLQFQDILRQQLGQAGSALEALAGHATALAAHLRDPAGHPPPPPPEALLRHMQDSYVMQAQRDAHHGVTARPAAPPGIELF